jgi:hypothetical protein
MAAVLVDMDAKMRELLDRRLEELRAELDKGRRMADELDAQRSTLQLQLARIGGAIHVLEELLAKAEQPGT